MESERGLKMIFVLLSMNDEYLEVIHKVIHRRLENRAHFYVSTQKNQY